MYTLKREYQPFSYLPDPFSNFSNQPLKHGFRLDKTIFPGSDVLAVPKFDKIESTRRALKGKKPIRT